MTPSPCESLEFSGSLDPLGPLKIPRRGPHPAGRRGAERSATTAFSHVDTSILPCPVFFVSPATEVLGKAVSASAVHLTHLRAKDKL